MDTDTLPTPAAVEAPADVLFVQPNAEDKKPRRVATAPAPMPHDAEAPYGWITDPTAPGGRRPKKTAGRQVKGGGRPVAAPKKRPATKPRTATVAEVTQGIPTAGDADHARQVGAIIDMGWMVGASMPTAPPGRFLGIDFRRITLMTKAQTGVLKDTRDSTARGIGAIADHVGAVGRVVEKLADEDGIAWALVAMMALTPMVAATAALWRMPMDKVEERAAAVDAEWTAFVAAQMANATEAPRAIEGETVAPGATYPGEVPLFDAGTLAA